MKLKDFIEQFVEPNTLIRLWYKVKENQEGVHETVEDNDDDTEMEWLLSKGRYADFEVIGVTDILYEGNYSEAVNLVIEREPEKEELCQE